MYFRQVFLTACLTALVASLGFSLYQFIFVNPIIFAAELYETAEPADIQTMAQIEEWSPGDGIERCFFTLMANFLMSLAYSLLLACAMVFHGPSSWFKGLVWGIAAYISLFVAPSIGLPPEIPGMQAADLNLRQNWWLVCVVSTAVGIAVFAFSPRLYKGVGLLVIMLPYFIGAPVADIHGFNHPNPDVVLVLTDLWHQFVVHTSIANALLWLIIGPTTGYLCHKFIDDMPSLQPNFN